MYMKSKITLFLISLHVFTLNGQNQHYMHNMHDYQPSRYVEWQFPWFKNIAGTKKLKEIHFQETLKNKEREAYYFNEKGLPIKGIYKINHYNQLLRPDKTYMHEYTYNNSENVVESRHYTKNNRLLLKKEYSYFSPSQLSSVQNSRKNKLRHESIFTYNPDSTLQKTEHYKYKGDSKQLISSYVYTYYSDKKVKTCKLFKKNKLKHTWNYECDERGKLVKKDTTSVCTMESMDTKGRKVVSRHFSENKKNAKKNISYYKLADAKETLNEFEVYDIKKNTEVLVYKVHYPDSSEPFYRYTAYYKNGAISYENSIVYFVYTPAVTQIKQKNSTSYTKKQRVINSRVETYTENGLPSICRLLRSKNKDYGRVEYRFSGESGVTISHYKKSALKKTYEGAIVYY